MQDPCVLACADGWMEQTEIGDDGIWDAVGLKNQQVAVLPKTIKKSFVRFICSSKSSCWNRKLSRFEKNCKKYFKNYIIYDFGEEIIWNKK
jgi:hypothetical protein